MKRKQVKPPNNNGSPTKAKAGRVASKTQSETKASGATSKNEASLTEQDKVLLHQLENTISSGLASFVEVGRALNNINTHRLYRGKSKTFHDYCVSNWQMTRSYAYRLIDAAACYDSLKSKLPAKGVLPTNESQLRPIIGRLKQDQWEAAWKKALDDADSVAPTTGEIVKVVNAMLGKSAAKTGQVLKKVRTNMLNETVSKVAKLVEKALGDRLAKASTLRGILEQIQRNLKSLINGSAS